MQIYSCLTFNGSCLEAMSFYKNCLGGELVFQTVGESPMSKKMPKKMKDCILHSTLTKGSWTLMGSDMVSLNGLVIGNNISIFLNFSSEEEIKNCYAKLSQGGSQDHPLENSFWGALFGDLTDKFGNHWMLNFNQQNDK